MELVPLLRLCQGSLHVLVTYSERHGMLKKHLRRLNALKHWMLGKLGGAFVRINSPFLVYSYTFKSDAYLGFGLNERFLSLYAPKPSSGPYKSSTLILQRHVRKRDKTRWELIFHPLGE